MTGDGNGYAHTHLRQDERQASLKGSALNDLFKQLHKSNLPAHMVGCDLDFVIVEKNPDCTPAVIDIKRTGEKVTFAEVIAYNVEIRRGRAVYLVYADDEAAIRAGRFLVHRYLGGNRGPTPPTIRSELYARIDNWEEYRRWEQEIRNATKSNGKAAQP